MKRLILSAEGAKLLQKQKHELENIIESHTPPFFQWVFVKSMKNNDVKVTFENIIDAETAKEAKIITLENLKTTDIGEYIDKVYPYLSGDRGCIWYSTSVYFNKDILNLID